MRFFPNSHSRTTCTSLRALGYIAARIETQQREEKTGVDDVMRTSKEQENQAGSLLPPLSSVQSGLFNRFISLSIALVHFAGLQRCCPRNQPTDPFVLPRGSLNASSSFSSLSSSSFSFVPSHLILFFVSILLSIR